MVEVATTQQVVVSTARRNLIRKSTRHPVAVKVQAHWVELAVIERIREMEAEGSRPKSMQLIKLARTECGVSPQLLAPSLQTPKNRSPTQEHELLSMPSNSSKDRVSVAKRSQSLSKQALTATSTSVTPVAADKVPRTIKP